MLIGTDTGVGLHPSQSVMLQLGFALILGYGVGLAWAVAQRPLNDLIRRKRPAMDIHAANHLL
jgi:hypothetical protein